MGLNCLHIQVALGFGSKGACCCRVVHGSGGNDQVGQTPGLPWGWSNEQSTMATETSAVHARHAPCKLRANACAKSVLRSKKSCPWPGPDSELRLPKMPPSSACVASGMMSLGILIKARCFDQKWMLQPVIQVPPGVHQFMEATFKGPPRLSRLDTQPGSSIVPSVLH
eukprot:1152094-Pelagomonas_calceolata.AAC.4